MRAMILAAGFGTRLRPLTEELPKPLIPVMGRPLIEHTINLLRRWDIRDIVINLHHLPEAIPRALGSGESRGVSISYVVEEGRILGTGGGIKGARELLDDGETFLVINGDILLEPDVGAALAHHRRLGALATMVLREDPRAEAFGSLDVDGEGRVRRLLGAPERADEQGLRKMMFSGVHLLEPEVFDLLPDEGCIVRSLYRSLVDGSGVVGGYIDGGVWEELGTVADYLRVHLALLEGARRPSHFPEPPPDAMLVEDGAEIDDSSYLEPPLYVGRGARVQARAQRSIIWRGALVDEPVSDAVVTTRGVVAP